jgi:hypothetical protein
VCAENLKGGDGVSTCPARITQASPTTIVVNISDAKD